MKNLRFFKWVVLSFLLPVISLGIAGEINVKKGCKNNPAVIGECFLIHGRISIYNGSPSVRIWQVGTNRLLGVLPSENEIMPDNVKKHLTLNTSIYGDFLVCPLTEFKPGHMQMVCIESASNIVIERYIEGEKDPIVFRHRD
jgi:hypothetical protein